MMDLGTAIGVALAAGFSLAWFLRGVRAQTFAASSAVRIDSLERLLNEAQHALADFFKALSADALKSNNQAFIQLAKATLEKFQEGARRDLDARHKAVDQLVKPLKELVVCRIRRQTRLLDFAELAVDFLEL